MSNKENHKEQKIQRLRNKVSENFENTMLVTHAKISGDLYDENNPLRLEYHLNKKRDARREVAEIRKLKSELITIIRNNHPEVMQIKEEVIRKNKAYRQIIISNPVYKNNGESSEERILNDINHHLENYLMRRKHKK